MADQASAELGKAGGEAAKGLLRGMPRWKIAALVGSVATMGAGVAMPLVAEPVPEQSSFTTEAPAVTTEQPRADSGSSGELASGFLPSVGAGETEPGETAGPPPSADAPAVQDEWSPAIFRAGFSFFVGFAIAYALRQFVKISVIALGLFFLALFGLQYAGFIEVKWALLQERYEQAGSWAAGEFESFRTFITGSLPSAALAAAGLVAGFRKR